MGSPVFNADASANRLELILMFGILGNAVPSNFWLIAQIFSRPALLQQIRDEVEVALQICSVLDDAEGSKERLAISVSSKAINMKSCPLLYSCYRETLRDISLLTSARLVMEDTIVADKYLLRKNSVVQIAGGVIGQDAKVWGNDAGQFIPERFLVQQPGRSTEDCGGPKTAMPSA